MYNFNALSLQNVIWRFFAYSDGVHGLANGQMALCSRLLTLPCRGHVAIRWLSQYTACKEIEGKTLQKRGRGQCDAVLF